MRRMYLCVCFFLAIQSSAYSATKSRVFSKVPNTPNSSKPVSLSSVLQDENLTGLNFESESNRERLQEEAEQYVQLKNKRVPDENLKSVIDECKVPLDSAGNPFCTLIVELDTREKGVSHREARRKRRQIVRKLAVKFRSGEIERLDSTNESDLGLALKHISEIQIVKSLAKKALEQPTCPPSSLLMALGLRIENEFPKSEYKELAISLYKRGTQCGPDASSIQASYRLGLMQIWAGHCDLAEETLSRIPDSPLAIDYRMRTAYWRFYCADQLKNEHLKTSLSSWLRKEYPLSLHGLVSRSINLMGDLPTSDPEVIFRSEAVPELNSITLAIETLLSQGYSRAAALILSANTGRLLSAEGPFQLYWAVLAQRVRDEPVCFQILAGLIRTNPLSVSKSVLELMYPLHQFDVIREFDRSVDPFLLLSLIRQESAFDERARSSAGALGLMQLQVTTARNFGRVSARQLYEPRVNIRVGVKYLKWLLSQYQGDVELALAAYNVGPARIHNWSRMYPIENHLLFFDLLPIRETRDYVSSIVRNYYWYHKLYAPKEEGRSIALQRPNLLEPFIVAPTVPKSPPMLPPEILLEPLSSSSPEVQSEEF